ncbi:hypothetical protein CKO27_16320 [Thiocystis violacea]|nr:hypothetical protein [Thiocystis violacea]
MRVWRLVQFDPFTEAMVVFAADGDQARRVAQQYEDESCLGKRDWINHAICMDVTDRGPVMLLRSPA